jgi:hypothetical protein
MAWVNGPTGPQGYQGAQGLQGRQGPTGPPFGATGPDFPYISTLTKLPFISSPTSSPISLTANYFASFYNLYSGSLGTSITINVPPTVPGYFPLPDQNGTFWWFKNNTSSTLTLTFAGDNAPSQVTVPSGGRKRVFYAYYNPTGLANYVVI